MGSQSFNAPQYMYQYKTPFNFISHLSPTKMAPWATATIMAVLLTILTIVMGSLFLTSSPSWAVFGVGIASGVFGLLAILTSLLLWYKTWNINVPNPLPPPPKPPQAPMTDAAKNRMQVIDNIRRLDIGPLPYTLVDSNNVMMWEDIMPKGPQLLRGKWPFGLVCLIMAVLNLIFIILIGANSGLIR